MFKLVKQLTESDTSCVKPSAESDNQLADKFSEFFIAKIAKIRQNLIHQRTNESVNAYSPPSLVSNLSSFCPATEEEVEKIILSASKSSCKLDPVPTSLIRSVLPALLPVITMIVNTSLSTGSFPSDLKSALVKPLLKKASLDCELYKNYRPVSNIPFLSKVIEKAVSNRLLEYLSDNNLLENYQSAYKAHHSTETALVYVQNRFMSLLDLGYCILLALLDLSAAFDTVDHGILIQFMESIGIKGTALDWFRSYLLDRTQRVLINDSQSNPESLHFGVPQGSIMGPIIFCLYTLPLGQIIRSFGLDYTIYADDTQIFNPFTRATLTDSMKKLEQCIAAIRTWMLNNHLKINDKKNAFEVIRLWINCSVASVVRWARIEPTFSR